MRMRTRFMKVFRLFRFKKYGIPIGPPIKSKPKNVLENASPSKELNIVEERDDEDEREACLALRERLPLELTENMWEDIVYEFILLHCDAVIRVHSFVHMVVVRRRYRKMQEASKIIQMHLREYAAKQRVKRMQQEKIDRERKERLEKHLQII